jgi:hypothetical protein
MSDWWIFKTNDGAVGYQRADGSYFLRRADGSEKALSEFELKRFLTSALDRKAVEDSLSELETALGFRLPADSRRTLIERVHRQARKGGLLRSSSPVIELLKQT